MKRIQVHAIKYTNEIIRAILRTFKHFLVFLPTNNNTKPLSIMTAIFYNRHH